MKKQTHRLLSLMLSLILVVGMIPGSLMTAHAAVGEIETITDEELLEVMEVDLRIGYEIIANSESTSFSKMSGPGWELKLSKQDNENRMQYYIVLHLYDYDALGGYIDFMYDMKPAADPANSVSFQVSVHGDCQVGFIRALTTDKEKVYGSSLDIIFAAGATLDTKQISHQGTGQWGSDVELNLRGVPGEQPGILYTKEIMNKYYFINWPQGSEVVTYADNLIIINYDTPTNGGPLFTHGEDYTTVTQVQFTETVDLFLNTRYGQFPIFEEHTNEKLAQKYQYIEDNGITAFSDLRAHLWFKESGDLADEYTVGDSIYYYFFPELSMLDYLFKTGINEQFKGGTRGFKVESSYELTNLSQRAVVASDTVVGIEEEYSYEKDNFVKVAGKNGEEYFTFETPGLYELRSSVKLMHNGHTVDSVGEVYHFYVNPAPAVLDGIEITRSNTNMAHTNGQEFDKKRIEVTANYSDGSSKVLDADDYTVEYQDGTALKTGDTYVTIKYTEDGVTKTTTKAVTVTESQYSCEFNSYDDLDFGTANVGYTSGIMTTDDVKAKSIVVEATGSGYHSYKYEISDTTKFEVVQESEGFATGGSEPGDTDSIRIAPKEGLPAGVYNETVYVYVQGSGEGHTFNLKFVVSDGHEHTYTTDFNKSNEFYHWRECTDPACTASDKGRKDVTPHNWDIEHPVVVDPATCTEDGVGKIECTICDAYQNTTVYATGHDWGEWPSYITPRCNEAPITITRTCENDESHTDSKTINGIHMAMDWTTDETHHWKVCGYCETEILVEKEAHKDTNSDNKCDTCDYPMTPAVQPTEIDEIKIEGLPAMQIGQTRNEYYSSIMSNCNDGTYKVNGNAYADGFYGNLETDGFDFMDENKNTISINDSVFTEGTYYYSEFFKLTEGYEFADVVTVKVTGVADADVEAIRDGEWLGVYVKFVLTEPETPTEINSITIEGLPAMQIGQTRNEYYSSIMSNCNDGTYKVNGNAYADGFYGNLETDGFDFMDENKNTIPINDSVFTEGTYYYSEFFKLTEGYEFADVVTVKVIGVADADVEVVRDGEWLEVDVKFVLTESAPTEYGITVNGGTASVGAGTAVTKATAGTVITLTVDESAIPAGKVFDKWEVVSGGVIVADGKFTMPESAVEIKATYKDAPVDPPFVDWIEISDVTAPVAGTDASIAPNYVVDSARNYTVEKAEWWMNDSDSKATEFVAGTNYRAVFTLVPKEGVVFDSPLKVKINGNDATVISSSEDKAVVSISLTATSAPVSHTCDIKPVAKDEPSCTEGGKEAYYKCEGCGKFYEDALGAKEITDLANWGNLPKLGHTESDWKSDKDNHWKECTVTACGVIIEDSKAAHKDDNKDGKCDVCEYNVGLPTTPDEDKPNDNPQTDDNSMIWLLIALLFVSGAGVVATTVYGKKKFSVK